MTAFVWQTLLILGLAYVLGCWIGCLLRRLVGAAQRPTVPVDAVPAGAIAGAAAAGAAMRQMASPPPQPARPSSAVPMPAPVRDAFRRADTLQPGPDAAQPPAAPAARPNQERSVDRFTQALSGPGGGAAASAAPPVISGPNDLKRIRGIDATIEAALDRLGVRTFAQIGAWKKEDVVRISQALGFKGRIEQENWIEQAQILASGKDTYYSSRLGQPQPMKKAPVSETKAAEPTKAPPPPASQPPQPPMAKAAPSVPSISRDAADAAASATAAAMAAAAAAARPIAKPPAPRAPPVEPVAKPASSPPKAETPAVVSAPLVTPPPSPPPAPAVAVAPPAAAAKPPAQPAATSVPVTTPAAPSLPEPPEAPAEAPAETPPAAATPPAIPAATSASAASVAGAAVAALSAAAQPEPKPEPEQASAASSPEPETNRGELGHLRSVRSEGLRGGQAPLDPRAAGALDDLKRIRGIGVLIEKKLNSMGVTRYEQIAKWTSTDIDRVSHVLDFKGRIERENWVEQARILASGGHTEFSRRTDRGDFGGL